MLTKISDYLSAYWDKYPREKLHDPTLEEIEQFISSGGHTFIQGRLLGLYVEYEDAILLAMYWCDLQDLSQSELSQTTREHYKLLREFDKPVYSYQVKSMFNRPYLGHYDENNLWRWK